MTQAMLDGMDHFWRMRSHVDMRALRPRPRRKVLPYIRSLGRQRGRHERRAVFRAFQPVP
jgi:aspartyl-tRNA(Asn)/glutamyl-tRNA(Gln) amidotransferase subunit A